MGKERLFIAQKMFPGKDTISPEIPLGLWANAGNVDKGVLKQIGFPFSLSDIFQAIKVKQRTAMTWIDVFYF